MGLVLSEYGAEYVEGPKSGVRIPTCHRTKMESVKPYSVDKDGRTVVLVNGKKYYTNHNFHNDEYRWAGEKLLI